MIVIEEAANDLRELRRFDGVLRPDDRRVVRNEPQPTLPFGEVVVNERSAVLARADVKNPPRPGCEANSGRARLQTSGFTFSEQPPLAEPVMSPHQLERTD